MSTGYNSCIINRVNATQEVPFSGLILTSYLGGWNFDQRYPSTSDVHLGLRKAARGWLKAVATDRKNVPSGVARLLHGIMFAWQTVRTPFTLFAFFLSLGILLYWIKSAHTKLYGVGELVFAAVAMWYALHALYETSQNGLANLLALIGGLYVMVRGLDNIGKGIEKDKTPLVDLWKALFETTWLRRQSRVEGWSSAKTAFLTLLKS